MRFKIHSISDIITNSSSEVFLVSKDLAVTAFTDTTPYWMRVYLGDLDGVDEYDIY